MHLVKIKYLFLSILLFNFNMHCAMLVRFLTVCGSRRMRNKIEERHEASNIISITNKTDYESLHDAINESNIAKITVLLLNNRNLVNCKNLYTSPLCIAIRSQNFEIVKVLLEMGADVDFIEFNDKYNLNHTPLMLACTYSNSDIVKILIDFKSPLSGIGDNIIGPLHCAISNGQVGNIALLNTIGMDLNYFDTDCYRTSIGSCEEQYFTNIPLCYACQFNNVEVVRFLIDKVGRDAACSLDIVGFTPLHWASYGGNLDVIKVLVEKYHVNTEIPAESKVGLGKTYNGYTALELSRKRKLSRAVSFFMQREYLKRRSLSNSVASEFGFGETNFA